MILCSLSIHSATGASEMHFLLSLASDSAILPCPSQTLLLYFHINCPEVSNTMRFLVFYGDLFEIGSTQSHAYTFSSCAVSCHFCFINLRHCLRIPIHSVRLLLGRTCKQGLCPSTFCNQGNGAGAAVAFYWGLANGMQVEVMCATSTTSNPGT